MKNESRVKKSIINARVNLCYFFLFLILSFFSRKIFLDTLGADFTGLTGTLQNILGYLNLAELGVSTAIAYNLFKPIQEGNKKNIIELISLFGYIYRKIGLIVLIAGLIIGVCLPYIFKNTIFSIPLILFTYLAFLLSSLYSYFLNYKQILLTANQKNYLVTIYYQGAQFITILLQMAVAYYLHSYYLYIILQMLYGICYCIILEKRLKKEYPWLTINLNNGKELLKKYPNILKSTKQVFIHRLKDFLLNKSDQVFIFAFASLKMVAYYGNYSLVFIRLTSLVTNALDGMGASVGNLVAEGNLPKIKAVFWQLISLRYIIAGILVYCIYNCIQPFICYWLGEEYLLGWDIVSLLLINFFISQTRGVVDMFNNAYGHYADVWSAWAEGFINITVTITCGIKFGIIGILLGKFISTFPIIVFWKPFYLYKDGFHENYFNYWKGIFRILIILLVAWISSQYITSLLQLDFMNNFMIFILNSLAHLIIFSIIYISLLFHFDLGTKDLIQRIPFIKKHRSCL
jgi:O-antigen/teichoic acid export membrane protein